MDALWILCLQLLPLKFLLNDFNSVFLSHFSEENEKEEDQIQTAKSTPGSINSPMMTPKPVRAFICGEKGDTSVVKYKITATPGYVFVIVVCIHFTGF